MKRQFPKTALCLLIAAFCFLYPVKGQAADRYKWILDKPNARIQCMDTATDKLLKSQFKKIKGYTYYFDKKGYAATGFTRIDGFYYYFQSNGAMIRGDWRADRYFLKNGRMAVSQFVKDASGALTYVGKDGRAVANYRKSRPAKFFRSSKGTRYRNLDGTYASHTWQCIKGHWYYFYSNGYMAKRKQLGKFYVDVNGRMVTSKWVAIGKYKYHYGLDGRLDKKVYVKKKPAKPNKVETITGNPVKK